VVRRLLDHLRCPACGEPLELQVLDGAGPDEQIDVGLLRCPAGHCYPIVRGVPRLLPDALARHAGELEAAARSAGPDARAALEHATRGAAGTHHPVDHRTRESFSLQWAHHEPGDATWGMGVDHRVQEYFVGPLRVGQGLEGKVLLDAGCGNGSQSVAYTELGLEVIAMDLSAGLEHGQAARHSRPGARPDRVHFVQGDLRAPPLAPASVDIIHSAGVLHHTPDTYETFRRLEPLLKPDGVFYVWLYKHEPLVTPVVDAIRAGTTALSPKACARLAAALAPAFQVFCATTDRLGVRSYPRMSRREAALALMDIFAAPHAHPHTVPEVFGWYRQAGFGEMWACNESRRGFGVCGVRTADPGQVPAMTAATRAAGSGPT